METKTNKLVNKKGKFNIVDVLVIVLVCLFIFGAFVVFDPFDWFAEAERREVSISYVVEIKGIDNDVANNIKVGDNVLNSVTDELIGKIFELQVEPAYEWKHVSGENEMVKVAIAGKSDVYIKIDIACVYEVGVGYIVGGQQIAVGTLVNIKLPNFVGSGYCISINELK